MFIDEGGGHLSEKICIYAVGCNTLAKKVVYTPWEEKFRQGAKFWAEKRNNYGESKKVPTLFEKKGNVRLVRSFASLRMT